MNIAFYLAKSDWMDNSFVRGAKDAGANTFVYHYRYTWSRIHFNAETDAYIIADANHFVGEAEKLVKDIGLDIIFMCVSDDNIHEDALKKLRKLKVPLINYHPDMGFLWFRVLRIAKYFDMVACAQSLHIRALTKKGISAHFIPFAGVPFKDKVAPVLFEGLRYMGSPFGDRAETLGFLHRNNLPVEVWGHNWDWFRRTESQDSIIHIKQAGFLLPLPSSKLISDCMYYLMSRVREEPAYLLSKIKQHVKHVVFPQPLDVEAFYGHLPGKVIMGRYDNEAFDSLVQSARINLGFSHMFSAKSYQPLCFQMRLRDIEIPMAGGFYLAEYSDNLVTCFTPGVHLETWKNKDELLEKANFYLNNPEKAACVAKAGQQHALAHHTWAHRYNKIFAILGLSKKFTIAFSKDKPNF